MVSEKSGVCQWSYSDIKDFVAVLEARRNRQIPELIVPESVL